MIAQTARRLRLRELRVEVEWTQQQLADKLAHLAWTHGQGHAAVNADMVAKWERDAKGISPRYRAQLYQLFGVTAEQLGFTPAPFAAPRRPVRDTESLDTIQVTHAEDMTDSAVGHLATALAHAELAPVVAPWLGCIQATIYADSVVLTGLNAALSQQLFDISVREPVAQVGRVRTDTHAVTTTDDPEFLDELRRLAQALGPFADAIFANSLSVTGQRDSGYELISLADVIRARVERKPPSNSAHGIAADTP